MRHHHPAASLLPLLAVSCLAAPVAEDQALTDQVEEGNYAATAFKDAWTEHLTAPTVDTLVWDGWELDEGAGCAVGLVQGGETIYLKGYGMASATQPWDYRTAAPVGSVAKTITALSLRRLEQDVAGLEMTDTLSEHLPGGVLGGKTLVQILGHDAGAPGGPVWEEGSYAATCVGDCADEKWDLSHPRVAYAQMDEGWALLADEEYSNVGYVALGAVIDEYTHDAAWLAPTQRGYEAYTWHQVGRFKNSDVYEGQMLSLALTHSWRVAEHDIPLYSRGSTYTTHQAADAWDTVDGKGVGFEGWEGPPGGWVMTVGDLARLIESFAKADIVEQAVVDEMTTEFSTVLGSYGQGVALENVPDVGGGGAGGQAPVPGEGEDPPLLEDELWWHGGDIGGHVAVWAWWPDLQFEHGKEPFGVALMCNKRDEAHSATHLLEVAKGIKDEYVESGITVWDDLDVTGLATVDQVDGQDYELDLDHAKIVDPPSFYVPLDQLRSSLYVSVDAVGSRYVTLSLVNGASPEDPEASVTPLGTWPYAPGTVLDAGIGAGTEIEVAGMGSYELSDVRLRTGFAKNGTALADTTLKATLDLRQLDEHHDQGWPAICGDLRREATCEPCSDGTKACLDVTIGYLDSAPR